MKIDIFHIIPIEKNNNIIGYSFSDNTIHYYNDIYPFKKGKFEKYSVNVPNKTIKILNKFYDNTLDIVDEKTAYKLKFSDKSIYNNKIKRFHVCNNDIRITYS